MGNTDVCGLPNLRYISGMHTFKIYYASMSVRFIVEPKCTLAASRAAVVSHVQYAPRALSRLEKRWDRRTDGRTDVRPLQYAYR